MLKPTAQWRTWDEPDRAVAVAQWRERDIKVVFPLRWAAIHGGPAMIEQAKIRIGDIEGRSGKHIAAGSVLLAFSRHVMVGPKIQRIEDQVPHNLLTMERQHTMDE